MDEKDIKELQKRGYDTKELDLKPARKQLAQTLGTIIIIFLLIIIFISTVSIIIALVVLGILVSIIIDFLLFNVWHYYAHKDKN